MTKTNRKTTTSDELASTYEAENQRMLEAYQATSCTVVRNWKGEVVQAHMTYPDRTSEMVHHVSPRDVVGPVSVTSSEANKQGLEVSER
jgi:hypothetical protein